MDTLKPLAGQARCAEPVTISATQLREGIEGGLYHQWPLTVLCPVQSKP